MIMNNYIPPVILINPEIAANYTEEKNLLFDSICLRENEEMDDIINIFYNPNLQYTLNSFTLYKFMYRNTNWIYDFGDGSGIGSIDKRFDEVKAWGCYEGANPGLLKKYFSCEGEGSGEFNLNTNSGSCDDD